MNSSRRQPIKSFNNDTVRPTLSQDLIADDKLTKLPHLTHNSLSPPNKMSFRKKRLLEKNHEQKSSTIKKKCRPLVPDCVMEVPTLPLNNSESEGDHQNKKLNVKKPDGGQRSDQSTQERTPGDGAVYRKLSQSPLAQERLASHIDIANNHLQQPGTIEHSACTSLLKECSKVPVVRLFRLDTRPETRDEDTTNESDKEQHPDQELQKTDQQEGLSVNNSYTSLEAICRRKQPVVKLSRLETQIDHKEEKQLSKSDSEQYSDQVPLPSNRKDHDGMDLSPLAQSATLPPNTDFTRKHDQQEGDRENKVSALLETICLKQPIVQLIRLNIETKNQLKRQATDVGDSEHHHDHVQALDGSPLNVQPEKQEEPSMDDSDSDQFNEQDLAMFSTYELERLRNIRENAKFLKSLKLLKVASTHKRRCVKRVKSQSDTVMRRSCRLKGITPPEENKPVVVIPARPKIPAGPIKMFPSNDVDHGAWMSFQDTWKSISTGKFSKPSSLKWRKLTSYANSLKSLTLEERAVTRTVLDSISSIAIHPSNTRTLVAAGDTYGNVGLWDLKHRSAGVYVFPLHSRKTSSVAFSPSNSEHLLSLGREGTIRCGDVSRSVFDEIYREEGILTSFDFLSAGGNILLVSHYDSKLSVVDRRTRPDTYDVCGCLNLKAVHSVSVHPLKRDFCVVAGQGTALIYDVRKLSKDMTQPVMSLLKHERSVLSASFSPVTGNHVLTYSVDKRLRVFRIEDFDQNKTPVKTISFPKAGYSDAPVTWDPKQENCFGHALMGSSQINIFHVKGQRVHTFTSAYFPFKTNVLAIHPTRNLVVAGTYRGKLCVWKKWKNKPDPPEENKSLE